MHNEAMNPILSCVINFYLPVVDDANPEGGGTHIPRYFGTHVGPERGGRRIASELGEWG
jgi:hypothetical protein